MKLSFLGLVLYCLLISCTSESTKAPEAGTFKEPLIQTQSPADTTPRVTGIGGIFFRSDAPDKDKSWYENNLKLAMDPYGSVFEFRNAHRPDEINYLRWSLFPKDDTSVLPADQSFMINYRVQNLVGLVRNLKLSGITVLDTIAVYNYGSFVHILDAEGRKVELWEPVDSVLTAMGSRTTK